MLRGVFLSALFGASTAIAHTSKMVAITGPQITMQSIDHAFAGSIKNRIVSGLKKKGMFVSELTVIEKDRQYVSVFKKQGARGFGGKLVLPGAAGGIVEHTVAFVRLDRENDRFVFAFDGQEYDIHVTADGFKNGHYQSPEYSMEYEGKTISFKLDGGSACYGYSAHLIAMIFPAHIY